MARYDVADQNITMPSIDVEVSGGKDAAGNTQTSSTLTDKFGVNTLNPALVSLTPSATTITDANVGSQKFTLTAVYSEAMSTSVNPTVGFPTSCKDPTASPATLTFDSGSWTNSTTYVATYDVANQNVTMASIDVQVSGAADAAGNVQTSGLESGNFGVNTVNPVVASVTPNLTSIADANVGSQTFTLAVTYAEAMDESVSPTISFPTSGRTHGGAGHADALLERLGQQHELRGHLRRGQPKRGDAEHRRGSVGRPGHQRARADCLHGGRQFRHRHAESTAQASAQRQ